LKIQLDLQVIRRSALEIFFVSFGNNSSTIVVYSAFGQRQLIHSWRIIMLQMSTISTQKFVIPQFSLFILALAIFSNFLAQVPASYPATIPAHAKAAAHSATAPSH
jgi:hypothetical protein